VLRLLPPKEILNTDRLPGTILLLGSLLFVVPPLRAQELEPRAYSPSPVGTHFLLVAGAESTGGVSVDPSLPIENVEATVDALAAAYGQTFGLLGRSASAALLLTYVDGEFSGDVMDQAQRVTRTGFADLRLRLGIGLLGSPALTPAEFARRIRGPTLGASLVIVAPTGEYLPDKLINLGANRWSFKPELGVAWPIGHWYLEQSAGVWLFTDNDDFFGGVRRQQDPLTTLQTHVSYTFRPGLWFAVSYTYYTGGRTTVDEVSKTDWQDNSRLGVTLSWPLTRQQSLKLSFSRGASSRIGSDFDTVGLAWQFAWFD